MDKLNADYLGKPFAGKNSITFVKAKAVEAPKPPPVPKDATGIKATASSEEKGKNNFAWRAVDNDENTRWCASGPDYPQWLQLELEKPQELTGIKIVWERNNSCYPCTIEGSADGKKWEQLIDASGLDKNMDNNTGHVDWKLSSKDVRFIKINCIKCTTRGYASIREVTLKGPNIKGIAPKLSAEQEKSAKDAYIKANDPHKDSGNIKPEIVKLTPEQEAQILKDVKVPEGFDATLFANPKAANYPVYVSAAPNGDLYVSSDGNGSLGRNPHRGRIVRLRDTDGDGSRGSGYRVREGRGLTARARLGS